MLFLDKMLMMFFWTIRNACFFLETVQGSVVLTFDDLAWSGDGSGVVGQEKLSERNVVGGVYTFSVGDASNRDGVRVKHSLCV